MVLAEQRSSETAPGDIHRAPSPGAGVCIVGPIPFKREPLLKRPLDVVLASAMLLASAPVWAAVALAIWLEDHGPIFYRQERWGRGGCKFSVLKFRTMVPDSDHRFGVRQ